MLLGKALNEKREPRNLRERRRILSSPPIFSLACREESMMGSQCRPRPVDVCRVDGQNELPLAALLIEVHLKYLVLGE